MGYLHVEEIMADGNAAKKVAEPAPAQNETAAAIQQLADAMIARGPKSPLEMTGLDEDRQRLLTSPGQPKRYRMIPGKSEETGSTFTLHVVESKGMPHGRIVQLVGYKHPDGMLVEERNGGKMPDGFPALKNQQEYPSIPEGQEVPRHMLTVRYLHWRWDNFWKADLKRLVGKELKSYHCRDGEEGLKTPWVAGKLAVVTPE